MSLLSLGEAEAAEDAALAFFHPTPVAGVPSASAAATAAFFKAVRALVRACGADAAREASCGSRGEDMVAAR